ncbi:hypothetical protein [Candidatus Uabimicrobium amorphum]|uniref:Uncharacterized protein n=1 Tax=Uabimicrobium amorphum TaxID=2596890 RepID=A0A5S9IQ93_UABAM|nr:hypothetical protein [Candidatus Uabimicrobium amorphum]BBM85690.1 hypothetical protein UABAM_04065 [Candidatus Uabimicrobium amorphum]
MRRYKSYQTGSVVFPTVLFTSLWIVTMTIFLLYYAHWQSTKQDITAYKSMNEQLKRDLRRELDEQLRGIENLTGFYSEDVDRTSLDKIITNLNTIRKNKSSEKGTKQYYGIYGLTSPDIQRIKLTATTYPVNIEVVLNAFEARIIELQDEEKTLNESLNEINKDISAKTQEYSIIKDRHNSRIEQLDREKENLEQKYKNFIAKVVEQKNLAIRNKEKAEATRREKENNLKKKTLEYENVILKKMSDIRLLQAEKYGGKEKQLSQPKLFDASEESVDGHIVFSNPLSNAIYIDLGRKNKIFRGLKFDVFRLAQRGEKEFKGRIEVKRVMDKISEAVVVSQVDEMDPLVNGDVIVNPIFNQNKPMYLSFTDSQLEKPRLAQLVKDIQEVDGIVEKKVTSKTNFVVIDNEKKGQEHENYTSAIKFKIPLMDEKTLLQYVGDQ